MKRLNRRTFITTSAAALGVAAGAYYLRPARKLKSDFRGTIIGGGRAQQNGKEFKYLAMMDLDADQPKGRYIQLDFQPHGVAQDPWNLNIISVFEKKGPGACEINLNTGTKTRDISTLEGRHFYGHGVYSVDGKKLYCTETVLATQEGLIAVRDAKTLKLEGEFPSYGANPHECHLVDDGKIIAITNGGGTKSSGLTPCVSYVDVASQKLIDKYEMQDERFNTGHLQISKNRDLVVISAPRDGLADTELGAISVLGKNGKLETFSTPSEIVKQLKGETLSVCIDESRGVFAATSPKGNFVSFWNLKNNKFISQIPLTSPRGIIMSVNNHFFIVSSGADASLMLIDAQTLRPLPESQVAKAGFSGSHLYRV